VWRRGLGSVVGAALAVGASVTGPAAFAAEAGGVDGQSKPHTEYSTGAEAFRHAWSLYSGVILAPFGSVREDGLRLRAAGGYGAYSYSGPRAFGPTSRIVDFKGTATFADLLLGYHKQVGPVTIKIFGGLTMAEHRITPDDPETTLRGPGYGAKAVLESWWTMSDQAWASLDLSWASLYDSYSARARLGWRFTPALSAGLEAGASGNVEGDVARVGVFVRYEWAGGELAVSGGVANDRLLEDIGNPRAAHASVPYGTVSWLTRF
jgi:cellulose biosynthesis protein BcsS